MANLKIRIAGITCLPPNLLDVTILPNKQFMLNWDYNGVDYSYDTNSAISVYASNDGVTYEILPGVIDFPGTTTTVDLSGKETWKEFYFKLRLMNRTCDEFSNVIFRQI